jgi:nucleoside-diphosphate-sugar epimerase
VDVVEAIRATLGTSFQPSGANAVLVTGKTGFIGRYLVPLLERQNRILAPTHSELDLLAGNVALGQFCLANGISEIIHLAYSR